MILVIGAGWYGCHIASELLKHGYTVCIVDKTNAFFTGSSVKNQNRLHLGYHYPRSPATIAECQKGFQEFKTKYPAFCSPVQNNMYCIAEQSKTSVEEFKMRFNHAGSTSYQGPFPEIHGVHPTWFLVDEEYIDNEKAALYFADTLGPYFRQLDESVFSSVSSICSALPESPTSILNCTYNQLDPQAFAEYELYCSLVYKIPWHQSFAYTIMDGPHFSIYPYKPSEHLYTVTSVVHGVVWRGQNRNEMPVWTTELENTVRKRVEDQVCSMIPTFPTSAYHSSFLSWKAKPETSEDDRSLRYHREGNYIRLYGGKITGIFDAAKQVLEALKS